MITREHWFTGTPLVVRTSDGMLRGAEIVRLPF